MQSRRGIFGYILLLSIFVHFLSHNSTFACKMTKVATQEVLLSFVGFFVYTYEDVLSVFV